MFNVSDVNTACDAKGITRMLKYKRGEERRNHSYIQGIKGDNRIRGLETLRPAFKCLIYVKSCPT